MSYVEDAFKKYIRKEVCEAAAVLSKKIDKALQNGGIGGVETDPVFTQSDAFNITAANKTAWSAAANNSHAHSNKSVLDGILAQQVQNWNLAYGWGNHGAVGYLTSESNLDVSKVTNLASAFKTVGGQSIIGTGDIPNAGGGATTDASQLTSGTLPNERLSNVPQSAIAGLSTDLGLKANSASPVLTGNVVLPATTNIGNVSNTEIGYLDGVTSPIQTQLNGKEPTVSAGTTAQYYRGDKTWQTLPTGATPTTDASQLTSGVLPDARLGPNVTQNGSAQTLTNKTISGSDNTLSNVPQSAVVNLNTDLAAKAPKNDPTFTGNVGLPSTTTIGNVSPAEIGHLDGVTSPLQTQLAGKEPTIAAGTTAQYWRGDKTWQTLPAGSSPTTDASLLTTGILNNLRLSAQVMRTDRFRIFNVLDYGAIGDDVADDTAAFQAAINACLIVGGTLFIPSPAVAFRITDTLNIVPILSGQPGYIAGNEVYLDIEGHGRPETHIRYYGAANKAVFYIRGWRFGSCKGIKIRIVDGNLARTDRVTRAGVVCYDLDTDSPSFSTTHLTFKDCHCYLGSGSGTTGFRLGRGVGHQPAWGADISNIQWENCSVWGNYQDTTSDSIGWLIEGANTLQNTWIGGFTAFLDKMFSNKPRSGAGNGPGNGAVYFYGLGTSNNNLEYEIHNTQTYLVSGGRYESGKRFLTVTNSSDSPNILIQGIEINDYKPADEILFYLDRPAALTLQNVNIFKDKKLTPYTDRMITLYGGGEGAVTGTLIVDNGSFEAADPFFWKGNATPWNVYVRGVGKITSGQRSIMMIDRVANAATTMPMTASGNGATTAINIPHGLGSTPAFFNVVATNAAAGNIAFVTANSTNIVVNYSVAPPNGTNNLTYNVTYRK